MHHNELQSKIISYLFHYLFPRLHYNLYIIHKEVCHIGRKKRIWYPGAIYHVVTRGNHKDDIFLCDDDYKDYLHSWHL